MFVLRAVIQVLRAVFGLAPGVTPFIICHFRYAGPPRELAGARGKILFGPPITSLFLFKNRWTVLQSVENIYNYAGPLMPFNAAVNALYSPRF